VIRCVTAGNASESHGARTWREYDFTVNDRKRPLFLTIFAGWLMLSGLVSPVFLVIACDQNFADSLASRPEMGAWQFIANHFGSAGVALVGFFMMLSAGIIGFGLWRMYPWARLAVIGIAGASTLWGGYEIIRTILAHNRVDLVMLIAWLIYAVPIYYFQRRNLKLLFE
jgi:hypothetical protein